jgi:hypothetical protein
MIVAFVGAALLFTNDITVLHVIGVPLLIFGGLTEAVLSILIFVRRVGTRRAMRR